MSTKNTQSEANWQIVSNCKKDQQYERIPAGWRLNALPGPEVKNYLDIPQQCGLLTKEELEITENYDAVALAAAIRDKELRCVDVTRAFSKVSASAVHSDGLSGLIWQ